MAEQPRTILSRKRDLIATSRIKLSEIAATIQSIYWRQIAKILDKLEIDDSGRIIDNEKNLALIDELQRVYAGLQSGQMPKITDKMQRDFTRMNSLDDQYFATFEGRQNKGFKDGKRVSESLRRQSLGITDQKNLKPEGFLASLIKDTSPVRDLRSILTRGIIGGVTLKSLVKEMNVAVVGTDALSGITDKQLNNLVFDAYHRFDRATSQTRADRIGLFAAVYENNLIEDSRCFCRNRFNRVWTDKEISSWKASTDPKKTREGANCLAIFHAAEYDPFVDQGGFNCRHYYRWITSAQAIRRRPELKGFFDDLSQRSVDFL